MKKRSRRNHSRAFKLEVARRVNESNKTVAEVSRELGLHDNMIRRWCKEVEALESLPQTEALKDEEIRRLRAELESVQQDNVILKKAAAYFARESR